MPFVNLPITARKTPLGPGRLNTWRDNLGWLRGCFAQQHRASNGEHNVMEVPRVCRRITFTGPSTYALANASTDITAVTRVGTGHIRLTLASGRFTADMRAQVNVSGTGIESKPWLHRVEVTSATQLEVYLSQLSSALGVVNGNTWAAADATFDIAIHSTPLTATNWATAIIGPGTRFPEGWTRGQTVGAPGYFSGVAQDYNETLFHTANWEAQFLAEHAADGNHNTRQVARHFVQGRFKSVGLYDKIQQLSPSTITLAEVSLGRVSVTFGTALVAGISPFICPDWTRQDATQTPAGTVLVTHAEVTSTTVTALWSYKYNKANNGWERARADFWAVWHGG
jgi:hypothetical protein